MVRNGLTSNYPNKISYLMICPIFGHTLGHKALPDFRRVALNIIDRVIPRFGGYA
jgi:hypothetical protein